MIADLMRWAVSEDAHWVLYQSLARIDWIFKLSKVVPVESYCFDFMRACQPFKYQTSMKL